MQVMVALLRGINVGGRNLLAMADLRRIAGEAGFSDVRTYIQSGNVVLASEEGEAEAVAQQLQDAIAEATDLTPAVVVRTRDELAAVVAQNPFADRDPAHLHVTFTDGDARQLTSALDLPAYAPEEAVAVGGDLYLHLPGGMGRSKLAVDLAKQKSPTGTTRNWRTVTKLLVMADEAAQAS